MIKFLLILVVFLAGFQSYAEVAIADANVNSKDTLKTEAAKPAVQLVKTFSKRDVCGILIDAITENPTEKVNVILKSKISNKSFEAESDDDGIFLFKNMPVGEYQLLIEDKDYILPGDPEKTASKRGFPVAKLVSFRLSITFACTGAAKPPAKIKCPLALKESLKASMAIISAGVPDSDKSSMTKMMNFFNMAFLFRDVWFQRVSRTRARACYQVWVYTKVRVIKLSIAG